MNRGCRTSQRDDFSEFSGKVHPNSVSRGLSRPVRDDRGGVHSAVRIGHIEKHLHAEVAPKTKTRRPETTNPRSNKPLFRAVNPASSSERCHGR